MTDSKNRIYGMRHRLRKFLKKHNINEKLVNIDEVIQRALNQPQPRKNCIAALIDYLEEKQIAYNPSIRKKYYPKVLRKIQSAAKKLGVDPKKLDFTRIIEIARNSAIQNRYKYYNAIKVYLRENDPEELKKIEQLKKEKQYACIKESAKRYMKEFKIRKAIDALAALNENPDKELVEKIYNDLEPQPNKVLKTVLLYLISKQRPINFKKLSEIFNMKRRIIMEYAIELGYRSCRVFGLQTIEDERKKELFKVLSTFVPNPKVCRALVEYLLSSKTQEKIAEEFGISEVALGYNLRKIKNALNTSDAGKIVEKLEKMKTEFVDACK